jgi:hypothetical protein
MDRKWRKGYSRESGEIIVAKKLAIQKVNGDNAHTQ